MDYFSNSDTSDSEMEIFTPNGVVDCSGSDDNSVDPLSDPLTSATFVANNHSSPPVSPTIAERPDYLGYEDDFSDIFIPGPPENSHFGAWMNPPSQATYISENGNTFTDTKPLIINDVPSAFFDVSQYAQPEVSTSSLNGDLEQHVDDSIVPDEVMKLFKKAKLPRLNMADMFYDSLLHFPLILFPSRSVLKILGEASERSDRLNSDHIACRLRKKPGDTGILEMTTLD